MIEVIREFTLIDFMGILFPGSIIMLLFHIEYDLWKMLDQLWHDSPNNAVCISFLLVGGYFIGNLLTEVGDFFENIIWGKTWINPRGSASIITGLINKDMTFEAMNSHEDKIKKVEALMSFCLLMILFFTLSISSGIAEVSFPQASFLFRFLLYGFLPAALMILLVLRLLWRIYDWKEAISIKEMLKRYINGLQEYTKKRDYIIQNDNIYMGFFPRKNNSDGTTRGQQAFCSQSGQEPPKIIISYTTKHNCETGGKKNNAGNSKIILFDGFRLMARNMLIITILSCFYGRYTNGTLHKYYQFLTQSTNRCMFLFIFQMILLLRYWRFSYLKYKYCYESYLQDQA